MAPRQVYGWVRDLPDHRDQLFAAALAPKAGLPAKVDLRPSCPPVYDQGQIGSCTANAIAGAVQFVRMKAGEKPAFNPSRLFIYYNERSIEHTVALDNGAQIRDGIKSINKLGVPPESEWPYDDTPADPDTHVFPIGSRAVQKPSPQVFSDAKKFTAISYQRLINNLAQLRGCLASGYPFVFGFVAYASLFDHFGTAKQAQKKIMPMPSADDQRIGGHAVMAVGYDDATSLFIVRNSWGAKNADHGYYYMPYAYLTDDTLASDFWTVRKIVS